MNLVELLKEQCRLRPEAPAIIDRNGKKARITTFAQLNRLSQQVGRVLVQAGVGPGDAVLIFQPMSTELYAALLGVIGIGGIAMFLDPSAGLAHIEACCTTMPPKALIAQEKAHLLRLRSAALRRIPNKICIGWPVPGAMSWSRIAECEPLRELFPVENQVPALITFTSGSTGQPKAAVRTHEFLLAQHRVLERCIELVPGEVDLATLPIFVLANLASGVTTVIPNADLRQVGEVDAEPVLRQITEHRVTRCAASPAFFQRLLAGVSRSPEALGSLRKVYIGGAPVFPKVLRSLAAAASDAQIHSVYGSTEAEPIAHIAAHEITPEDESAMLEGRGLIAGQPVPDIRLLIIQDRWGTPIEDMDRTEFADLCLAPGQVGEIVVSGDHVLPGYLHGIGDQETKFRVEGRAWHRTGDAGWLDEKRRLWLMGRCSAKLQHDGRTLWPFAVECAAQEQPGIHRAALVEHNGRCLLAVEPEPSGQPVDMERLKATLSWAKLDAVVVLKQLPVDPRHNAKIAYKELHALLDH
ncbi:AMP-binding protein [Verrucomicrobiota bacterium sgz303538]